MKHFSAVFIEGPYAFLMQRKGWGLRRLCFRGITTKYSLWGPALVSDLLEAAKQPKGLGSIAYVTLWICKVTDTMSTRMLRLCYQLQSDPYGVTLTVYVHLVCLVEWNLLLMPVVIEGKKRGVELLNRRKGVSLQPCLQLCDAAWCSNNVWESEIAKEKEREKDCERSWEMKPPLSPVSELCTSHFISYSALVIKSSVVFAISHSHAASVGLHLGTAVLVLMLLC